jgi:hypothetical protein
MQSGIGVIEPESQRGTGRSGDQRRKWMAEVTLEEVTKVFGEDVVAVDKMASRI